jgi:excisionase family DNA binding protein
VSANGTGGKYYGQVDVTPPARRSAAANDWLSSGEVGALLGVSRKTVVRWVNAGLLPARRIRAGGQYRVERVAVERFKAEQQQEVRPDATKEGRSQSKAS